MAEEPRGRALIEGRYGQLGCGEARLRLGGAECSVDELLTRMGLRFDDCRPIDVQELAEGRYVVRYLDGQDQRVVACEFNDKLEVLSEARGHIAEWIGEQAYFSFYSGH